jgi:two-component sensor histidine kinase/AmiR/NasT family two-component response regulator
MEKAKIMVVEDNKIISLEIRQRLESMGYEVIAVSYTGEDAVSNATEKIPDLVLMDIKLGGKMDGIEAAEKIRFLLDIPVVYLTAYSDEATLERAKVTEPFGYIVKPLEERELHSTIEISLYKHKIEKKLKESESKYRAIVDGFDGFVYIATSDYKVKYLNQRLANKIGKSPINELCYNAFYGKNSVCSWCKMDYVLKGKTVRFERKSESEDVWFDEVHTPIINDNRQMMMQVMIRDMTERKRNEEKITSALREKEVMLSELHHRVKNNLQIITSLLRIQSVNITDKEALDAIKVSQNRVNSMALVHEKLYKSKNLSLIDFEDYVKHLTSHLFQAFGIKKSNFELNLNVQKVFLGVDTAIPVGLIINELVSNSLKHAFKDRKQGQIRVEMNRSNKSSYILKVSDDGVGIPKDIDPEKTSTLGLQLVLMLAKQLGGDISISGEKGTQILIHFKESIYKERLENKKIEDILK